MKRPVRRKNGNCCSYFCSYFGFFLSEILCKSLIIKDGAGESAFAKAAAESGNRTLISGFLLIGFDALEESASQRRLHCRRVSVGGAAALRAGVFCGPSPLPLSHRMGEGESYCGGGVTQGGARSSLALGWAQTS